MKFRKYTFKDVLFLILLASATSSIYTAWKNYENARNLEEKIRALEDELIQLNSEIKYLQGERAL